MFYFGREKQAKYAFPLGTWLHLIVLTKTNIEFYVVYAWLILSLFADSPIFDE